MGCRAWSHEYVASESYVYWGYSSLQSGVRSRSLFGYGVFNRIYRVSTVLTWGLGFKASKPYTPTLICQRHVQGIQSCIRGPQYRPKYTIVLIMGTPKKVPLILGNPLVVGFLSRNTLRTPRPQTLNQRPRPGFWRYFKTQQPLSILESHMGGCQKYGLFLGTLNIRGHIIIGIQKGTPILAEVKGTWARCRTFAVLQPCARFCRKPLREAVIEVSRAPTWEQLGFGYPMGARV